MDLPGCFASARIPWTVARRGGLLRGCRCQELMSSFVMRGARSADSLEMKAGGERLRSSRAPGRAFDAGGRVAVGHGARWAMRRQGGWLEAVASRTG